MKTSVKFFSIPAIYSEDAQNELNRFINSVSVVQLDKELVHNGDSSFWAVAVTFHKDNVFEPNKTTKKPRVDYREKLSEDDFALYTQLRDWRKKRSEQDGVAVYIIFTNDQLAQIAEKKMTTKTDLLSIKGVGEERADKYIDEVAAIVHASVPRKKKTSDNNTL